MFILPIQLPYREVWFNIYKRSDQHFSLVSQGIITFKTIFRVWEKIEEKMKAMGAANGFLKQKIGNWAKSKGHSVTWKEIKE